MDLIPNVMDMSVCHCRPSPVTLQFLVAAAGLINIGIDPFTN